MFLPDLINYEYKRSYFCNNHATVQIKFIGVYGCGTGLNSYKNELGWIKYIINEVQLGIIQSHQILSFL